MPRLSSSLPKYRKHRASGQAIVSLSGQDHYLGPYGTKTSRMEYDRLIAEWLAAGRRPLSHRGGQEDGFTIVELVAAYKKFAEGYYRKNGKVTREVATILLAAKVLREMYGREPASEFGPLKLQAVQQAMIRLEWKRTSINKQIQRIVRIFSWGVSQQLVQANIAQALREVKGIHQGRTEAVESAPVLPVDDATINATLDHLPPLVADLVQLQRLTGCRPDEVCMIRPVDVDTTGPVWAYRPESHKTQHHGRDRVIFIGPKGQAILRPYLLRDKTTYCFCPSEGERKRRELAHERRVTPVGQGNGLGTNRKRHPARPAGKRYTTDSYRRAITRACQAAGIEPWGPNRLRHTAATEIRKRFGLEAAQVTLGHAGADVTQVYAERDLEKAAAVMAQVG